ncbi:MAG: NYN domain protein [Firmicutes bacterium ADurb.Bin182]|nr:MAG: NYN domain protein [Firmicutes bacterium ADurb.Bin182]
MEEKRFAVLIDADNVSSKYIKYIMEEIADYGIATYKRIYGDWTRAAGAAWKDVLLENSVTPVQQYNYTAGKNATDSAMIIDAMDILYSGNVDGYCIVSSDSDFTKLASRLRESGMMVVGMGERKTPKPFIAACNQFKYLDVLAESEKKSMEIEAIQSAVPKAAETEKKPGAGQAEAEKAPDPAKAAGAQDAVKVMTDIEVIKKAIIKMVSESDAEDQSIDMGELGSRLVKRYPDFDVRNYGDTKLSKFLKKFDFLTIDTKGKGTSMRVSLKSETGRNSESNAASARKRKPRGKKAAEKQ